MTTVNYPNPVMVNGYSCKNCTDVDLAKKHIDPAHPQDGPYDINAKERAPKAGVSPTPSVIFGGALAGLSSGASTSGGSQSRPVVGQVLNITA